MLLIPAVPEYPETVLLLCCCAGLPEIQGHGAIQARTVLDQHVPLAAIPRKSSRCRWEQLVAGRPCTRELNEGAIKHDRNNFGSTNNRTTAHESTWLGLLHSRGASQSSWCWVGPEGQGVPRDREQGRPAPFPAPIQTCSTPLSQQGELLKLQISSKAQNNSKAPQKNGICSKEQAQAIYKPIMPTNLLENESHNIPWHLLGAT